MVVERFFTDAEHQREAEFESLRLQKVALASDNERTCGDKHTSWRRLGDLIGVDPIDLRCHLVLPAWTMAHFESCCLIETECGHRQTSWVLNDTDGRTMEFRMHEEISAVHVAFDQSFILLRVSTTNDKIVFTGDEPNELFEPKYLALDTANLGLLEFFVVSSRCLLSLFDGHTGSILSFDFFCIGFLADLEVLLDIELG